MAKKTKVTDVSVNPDKFADALGALVKELSGEVCQEAVDVLQEVSNEALYDVRRTAPASRSAKGTGGHHLRDAFRLDAILYRNVMGSDFNFGVPAKFVIHAPKWHKYSIVHLLEKGHLVAGFNISKPFVQPRPFMVPAEQRAKQKIIERLREKGLIET